MAAIDLDEVVWASLSRLDIAPKRVQRSQHDGQLCYGHEDAKADGVYCFGLEVPTDE